MGLMWFGRLNEASCAGFGIQDIGQDIGAFSIPLG